MEDTVAITADPPVMATADHIDSWLPLVCHFFSTFLRLRNFWVHFTGSYPARSAPTARLDAFSGETPAATMRSYARLTAGVISRG